MNPDIALQRAGAADAAEVAAMAGELLNEIMDAIGVRAFDFDLGETTARLRDFFDREKYFVFVAFDDNERASGFVSLCESHALYAGGTFGTIPEFYVRPAFRSNGVGRGLLDAARAFAAARGWTRLEVTTPPLPEFDRTLAFYEREGFAITGGRKVKRAF